MKNFKKALCIMLSVILCLQLGTIGFAAGETSSDYTIVNPYADVVWEGDDAWGAHNLQRC